MRSTSVSSGRGSIPRARSRSSLPTFPGSSERRSSSVSAANAPTVSMPAWASRSALRGPTPGSLRTGSCARNRASSPGRTTVMPPGLRAVRRDLGYHLRRRHAERARQPRRPAHGGLHRLRELSRAQEVGRDLAEIEVALVDSRPLHRRDDGLRRSPRRLASTRGRANAGAARTRREGTGAALRPRSSRNGCRTRVRRSWRWRRRRVRGDRRRRSAAASGATDPRAPRPRRRRRPGRGARRSRSKATLPMRRVSREKHGCDQAQL